MTFQPKRVLLGMTLAASTAFSALSVPAVSAAPIAMPDVADLTFPVIVVFQDQTPFHQNLRNAHADERAAAAPDAWNYLDAGVLGTVQRLESLHHFKARHVFSHAAKGFAVELTQQQIDALRAEPTVATIEPDLPVKIDAQSLPWGVDRVEADRSFTLAGNGSGAVGNVNVYVIDTGIAAHRDLNLVRHLDFIDTNNTDCNGHGTHVAGTIGAMDNTVDVVGVAPGVPLTALKVLDCSGNGTSSGILKAIDWVTANAARPAVVNMSLGGSASQTLDDAVRRSVSANIVYAVAAGNSGVDACTVSPARAGLAGNGLDNGIVTTAAIDSANAEPSWSNYGKCVSVWAPGVGIVSTYTGNGMASMSGTSMASPHVAGAAALYLSRNPSASPAQTEYAIRTNALPTGTSSKDGRGINLLQVNRF
ncbi:S8 family peptidase [Noviherbaspirillum galbum]|uniref:S8 family peptidase n=1 Tax=Noviherbaspirillum galbum TaxID=2709383 RepID=A0A6B3SXX8_9BURK|nr:S8 family peptidase [Noviherbaspirillum galbum]NEX64066.1 S8 family peptidase [Noviherbaspirillum galbum]